MDAKHASLMHDYIQLENEFGTLKDRLQAAKMRKATLLAEVRFLRRRLKKLKGIPSKVKGQEMDSATPHWQSPPACSAKAANALVARQPSSLSFKNSRFSSMEIPVFWEPLRSNGCDESANPNLVNDNVGLVSALKTSAFRDKPNVFMTAMARKRKISWQDQISLECN